MKTSTKHITDTRVLVSVTLGHEELQSAEQVALHKIAKNIKVPGFRKGHVPIAVAKKNADPNNLNQEILENALSKGVADAYLNNGLQALERPEVEVKKFVPGEVLEFTAEGDVLPEVKLGSYTNLKVKKAEVKISKTDIDEVIERIRNSFAKKHESNEPAKDGDEVVIDFVGKLNGKEFEGGAGNEYPLTLGSKSFIPGFEESLIGVKAGDKTTVKVTFPSDYQSTKLAGKKAEFDVTVHKVNAVELPKLDDEFAAKVGSFTSMEELNSDIKRELTAQKERENTEKLKDDLVKQVVDKSKVSVPKVLLDDQIRSIEQDLQQNLMYQGMAFDDYLKSKSYKNRDEWIENEATLNAENRIKAGLVLAELSKVLKIEATADELAEHINLYRQQYAKQPDMAKRFDEPEAQREVANRLITEKTVDKLVELNK